MVQLKWHCRCRGYDNNNYFLTNQSQNNVTTNYRYASYFFCHKRKNELILLLSDHCNDQQPAPVLDLFPFFCQKPELL